MATTITGKLNKAAKSQRLNVLCLLHHSARALNLLRLKINQNYLTNFSQLK